MLIQIGIWCPQDPYLTEAIDSWFKNRLPQAELFLYDLDFRDPPKHFAVYLFNITTTNRGNLLEYALKWSYLEPHHTFIVIEEQLLTNQEHRDLELHLRVHPPSARNNILTNGVSGWMNMSERIVTFLKQKAEQVDAGGAYSPVAEAARAAFQQGFPYPPPNPKTE